MQSTRSELIIIVCGFGNMRSIFSTLLYVAIFGCAYSHLAKSAERDRFLCNLSSGEKAFQQTPGPRCLKNALEEGWVNLIFDKPILVDYHPDSVVIENDSIKVWMKFINANPIRSADGRWKYTSFKGVHKFWCKNQQQLLVQGTYRLGDTIVHERLSSELILEIEPGTLSYSLRSYFCGGLMRDPAEITVSSHESDETIAELTEAEYRFQFRCPESLSSSEERKKRT